ncbi:hypothetical protein [Streptomyces sp. AK02-01A]|uniref:hypothetical protein n=1 Tax=Streptomyces sp. AK02-01A TaxID=3028648 RepID=UPI0029BE3A4C|nr:hypothetical protein [Streptomyces sp. AK02-01A]MDX3850264.1 hypothetical protein [Streptomyces sp. AK02-01A]
MSRHLRLRFAVLTAVTAGAMLVPTAAAVAADRTPTPVPSTAEQSAEGADRAPTPVPSTAEQSTEGDKALDKRKAEAAKAASAARAEAAKSAPRGGVAAGEAPAGNTSSTALIGSATGVLLLAGAGTFVVRRRSAERHTI